MPRRPHLGELERGLVVASSRVRSAKRDKEAEKRRRRKSSTPSLPGLSLLETILVRPATRRQYVQRLEDFVRWAMLAQKSWSSFTEMDEVVMMYFDAQYLDGAPSDDGGKLAAALQMAYPGLHRRLNEQLPRAMRALRSWAKNGPGDQRLPLPFSLLCGVIGVLLHRRMIAECLCLLIQHDAYLRPSEACSLTVMQLIPPLDQEHVAYAKWAVNIAPFELERPAKTGLWDESLTLSLAPWVDPFLHRLRRGRAPTDGLWPFTLSKLGTAFGSAARSLGISHLKPTLYSNRHGGASEDLLRHRRTLEEVQRRGRWRAPTSVRRYTKEAKLIAEMHKVAPSVRAFCHQMELNLGQFMAHPELVPPLPRTSQKECLRPPRSVSSKPTSVKP